MQMYPIVGMFALQLRPVIRLGKYLNHRHVSVGLGRDRGLASHPELIAQKIHKQLFLLHVADQASLFANILTLGVKHEKCYIGYRVIIIICHC